MKISKLISVVVVFGIISGCGSSDKVIMKYKFIKGEFSYVMSDSSGNSLASGNMKFDYLKEKDLSGSYTAVKDPSIKFDGEETLNGGTFTGYFNDSLSIVWLNMNPMVADANIFIIAEDHTDSLKGGWYYSTFRGKKSGGLFSAKRIK